MRPGGAEYPPADSLCKQKSSGKGESLLRLRGHGQTGGDLEAQAAVRLPQGRLDRLG